MARPEKDGIEYYSMNADFLSDRKIRKVIRKCGAESVAVLISLLGFIYKDAGYYVAFDDDLSFDISEQLIDVKEDSIQHVILTLLEVNFFSQDVYKKHKVLTSNGIQKRYLEATKRRKNVVIADIYRVNVYNNLVNVDKSTQSKEKESKEKESKEKEIESKGNAAAELVYQPLLNFIEYKNYYTENEAWLNGVFLRFEKFGVKKETIPILINEFGLIQVGRSHKGWETKEDFAEHFTNWLNIKLEKIKNGNHKNTSGKTSSPNRTRADALRAAKRASTANT